MAKEAWPEGEELRMFKSLSSLGGGAGSSDGRAGSSDAAPATAAPTPAAEELFPPGAGTVECLLENETVGKAIADIGEALSQVAAGTVSDETEDLLFRSVSLLEPLHFVRTCSRACEASPSEIDREVSLAEVSPASRNLTKRLRSLEPAPSTEPPPPWRWEKYRKRW